MAAHARVPLGLRDLCNTKRGPFLQQGLRPFTSLGGFRSLGLTKEVRKCRTRASASTSPSSDGRRQSRWDPLLADADSPCPVPPEQQPVNEYSDLAEAFFFDWATMGPVNLLLRLSSVGFAVALTLGFPIASASFDPHTQALQCVLCTVAGGLFPVTLLTARLLLGWQYVGSRLQSATVVYEETGWYDGQVWVKTPELLARDRLLATYRVKPVLNKLQRVLVGLSLSLSLTLGLVAFIPPYTPTAEPYSNSFFQQNGESAQTVPYSLTQETRFGRFSGSYDPASVERFEDSELSEEGADDPELRLYRSMHGPRIAVEGERESVAVEPASATGTYTYGFQYLSFPADDLFSLEVDDSALYGEDDTQALSSDFPGLSDVTIVAVAERIEDWTEAGFTEVKGSEKLAVLGAGLRSSVQTTSRVSDHLGVERDGALDVLKSLKPDRE